jgi:signal transduction histidine kinase
VEAGAGVAAVRRITSRVVLLIAGAAIAPLLAYGLASMLTLREATRRSVLEGNQRVARQVAEQIAQYIVHNQRVLRSIGLELGGTGLESWQQQRILRDYALDFPELREISLFTPGGRLIATSRVTGATLSIPDAPSIGPDGTYVAPVQLDADFLPTTTLAVRLTRASEDSGWVVGELALEELWRVVDRIRIGARGYALVVAEGQRLIAHGNPEEKRFIATGAVGGVQTPEQRFAAAHLRDGSSHDSFYPDENGEQMVAVAARVPDLPWVVIVEQPTEEAFALEGSLRTQLLAVIGIALFGTVTIGWLWGRAFITRIFALTSATRAIADGRLDERVAVSGRDEIRQLGDAFNSMADRLVELQEDVRKQERQAMFGRIAAGLVHDLSHPLQNIYNSCKLIVKMFDDLDYRDTFKRTVDREMIQVKRVLEDLRNIARPIPLERFPLELDRSVAEVVDAMVPHAETAGVALRAETAARGAYLSGDLFALGRVYRNLIINAIQATAPGGEVVVSTDADGERVRVRVADTGCGIPADRLADIFEDFVTTKRRGLGLGLAISRKIVEQLGGRISVSSEVGKGTTFVLEFPRTEAPRLTLVAG